VKRRCYQESIHNARVVSTRGKGRTLTERGVVGRETLHELYWLGRRKLELVESWVGGRGTKPVKALIGGGGTKEEGWFRQTNDQVKKRA